MNVLELFAGIGGIGLGLERAGMTVVGQVEIDPYCQRVLARHGPEVPRHDDVRTTPQWWKSTERPAVDVVCGGFPCQPFSHAGFQRGIDDERWMWPEMAATIRAVEPRYVLVENVAALVRDRVAWGIILGTLADLGFDAEWSVLRASDFGAPHNRERVYLLAHAAGVDGISWDRLDAGGTGEAPFAVGGLFGLAAHQRRRAASEWLERQPGVARLANGIPDQTQRLHALGNAVVPQIAEHIGRHIMARERVAA